MGCCISVPSPPNYQSNRHPNSNSSSREITSSQPPSQSVLPNISTQAITNSDQHEIQKCERKQHTNKPLQRHVWSSSDRIWTIAELERERKEFFDTRTSGKPEIWQTLKAVLEILWGTRDVEDTSDNALNTAQQILDAAEIIVPHSNMSPGVYDSFGAYYPIPKHIISNPTNMISIPDKSSRSESLRHESCNDEIIRQREEKGKSVAKPVDLIKLRVKLSDRDASPIQVLIGKEDPVRVVALKIIEESELPSSKSIRIAYMGKILRETQSLKAQGWQEEHVINALVFG